MKSKLALLLAILLFFNIILPIRVSASSIHDQSKPIFGLTADQVVEKYNQLTDQQKDQVLRSLGNTSIFANSLFGNIFNSTFGVVEDAVKKLGDLFFQANGVVYKLGSSALAWVSRLIDKVFNNQLNDVNISQPVINDLYLNTRSLVYTSEPMFINGHFPGISYDLYKSNFSSIFPLKYGNASFALAQDSNIYSTEFCTALGQNKECLLVDINNHAIYIGEVGRYFTLENGNIIISYINPNYSQLPIYIGNAYFTYFWTTAGNEWSYTGSYNHFVLGTFSGRDYMSSLLNVLNTYFVSIDTYIVIDQDVASLHYVDHSSSSVNITNNTYYNYIYNIPDVTPLNVTNIVSNTAIRYDPVENLIQYLPDNYNIEQNFSVVNNYYISSGSAISGQAIDVNIVSPGVIDVRVINPEDFSTQIQNDVSQDIVNNYDLDINAGNLTPTITTVKNTAVNNLNEVAPTTGSSILWIPFMFNAIPSDLRKIILSFLIVAVIVCVYHNK